MKINDSARLLGMQSYQNTSRTKNQATQAYANGTPRDGVTISSAALEMARELQEDGDVRSERLLQVKQAIQDNAYHVETSAVVRKMLDAYGE
ncbi:MAG TPA: flagellar biosynthesis anti-sigma factor FlgM [Bacilli bacterium]|nr:flagellar biosynthesis anti-sigma factor FlgM [Bacilli bacterium]